MNSGVGINASTPPVASPGSGAKPVGAVPTRIEGSSTRLRSPSSIGSDSFLAALPSALPIADSAPMPQREEERKVGMTTEEAAKKIAVVKEDAARKLAAVREEAARKTAAAQEEAARKAAEGWASSAPRKAIESTERPWAVSLDQVDCFAWVAWIAPQGVDHLPGLLLICWRLISPRIFVTCSMHQADSYLCFPQAQLLLTQRSNIFPFGLTCISFYLIWISCYLGSGAFDPTEPRDLKPYLPGISSHWCGGFDWRGGEGPCTPSGGSGQAGGKRGRERPGGVGTYCPWGPGPPPHHDCSAVTQGVSVPVGVAIV